MTFAHTAGILASAQGWTACGAFASWTSRLRSLPPATASPPRVFSPPDSRLERSGAAQPLGDHRPAGASPLARDALGVVRLLDHWVAKALGRGGARRKRVSRAPVARHDRAGWSPTGGRRRRPRYRGVRGLLPLDREPAIAALTSHPERSGGGPRRSRRLDARVPRPTPRLTSAAPLASLAPATEVSTVRRRLPVSPGHVPTGVSTVPHDRRPGIRMRPTTVTPSPSQITG